MLVGVAFYSLIIGIISAFFTSKDTKDSLVAKRLLMIEEFCKNLNIEPNLREKMEDAISYSSSKLVYLWLNSDEDIFSELSIKLKYDFLVAIHQSLITSCEFFRNRDMSFVVRVIPLLKPLKLSAGDAIWLVGDAASSSRFGFLIFSLFHS